jgi:O-antigen ligase
VFPNNWPRIFFQSQIWSLLGFFILLALINKRGPAVIKSISEAREGAEGAERARISASGGKSEAEIGAAAASQGQTTASFYAAGMSILLSIAFATILLSLSRSFFIGFAAGLILFLILNGKKLRRAIIWIGTSAVAGLLLVLLIAYFPFPRSIIGGSFFSLFGNRVSDLSEAAVRSRWDLLPPLWQKIAARPIEGSGFGTTVTYKSSDPRALELNPTGLFTTYAFEWGYLDMWLKLGLTGLVAYLVLLWTIFHRGWLIVRSSEFGVRSQHTTLSSQLPTILGLLTGLVALAVVHFFTPYLNHPLGITYVLLTERMFTSTLKKE